MRLLSTLGRSDPSRQPIVIDTDPGIDDVVTLALAARSPSLDVLAVTTSYGNAEIARTTRNAREVLRLSGRTDIPVLAGSCAPLIRPLVTAPETHGLSGVGYAPVPAASFQAEPNPRVLLTVLNAVAEPVTLVTLGPLTNLSHALDADETLVRSKVKRHIGMFGNISERGNTNRWADFNAWCDPEATDHVIRSGLDTLMVGLDVTRRMVLTAAEVGRLAASRDPLVGWLGAALQFYVEFHVQQERLDGCVVNDVLTIGELLSPGLLTFEQTHLWVDLDEGDHRGHTRERHQGGLTAVAVDVDVERMRRLLEPVLGNSWWDQ